MRIPFAHSILFGFYIPFSIYVHNRGEVDIKDLLLPFLIVLFINILIFALAKTLKWNIWALSILISLSWIIFFQFDAIVFLCNLIGVAFRYFVLFIILLYILCTFIIFRLSKKTVLTLNRAFFLTSIFMYVIPTFLFAQGFIEEVGLLFVKEKAINIIDIDSPDKITAHYETDIYYVILDSYGGNEVLEKYMNFKNDAFMQMLEKKGFLISKDSRSNYPATIFSLTSTFNMAYLDSFTQIYGEDFKNIKPLQDAMYNSVVFNLLKKYGYNIVTILSEPHLNYKDSNNIIDQIELYTEGNQYYLALLKNTPLKLLSSIEKLFFDLDADGKPWIPNSIDWALEKSLSYSNNSRNDFVFIHILCPHEPYYFNQDGEIDLTFKTEKWNNYAGPFNKYRDAYLSNLQGLNIKIESYLDSLLHIAEKTPIVILQGDHGPSEIMSEVLEREGFDELTFRTSILNAFLLPEEGRDIIRDRLSSVNTFRLILPLITGGEMRVLEDKIFHVQYKKPYKYSEFNK